MQESYREREKLIEYGLLMINTVKKKIKKATEYKMVTIKLSLTVRKRKAIK